MPEDTTTESSDAPLRDDRATIPEPPAGPDIPIPVPDGPNPAPEVPDLPSLPVDPDDVPDAAAQPEAAPGAEHQASPGSIPTIGPVRPVVPMPTVIPNPRPVPMPTVSQQPAPAAPAPPNPDPGTTTAEETAATGDSEPGSYGAPAVGADQRSDDAPTGDSASADDDNTPTGDSEPGFPGDSVYRPEPASGSVSDVAAGDLAAADTAVGDHAADDSAPADAATADLEDRPTGDSEPGHIVATGYRPEPADEDDAPTGDSEPGHWADAGNRSEAGSPRDGDADAGTGTTHAPVSPADEDDLPTGDPEPAWATSTAQLSGALDAGAPRPAAAAPAPEPEPHAPAAGGPTRVEPSAPSGPRPPGPRPSGQRPRGGRPGGPGARPGGRPSPVPSAPLHPGVVEPVVESVDPHLWGRIDEHGVVYVTTAAGERAIGNWQAGDTEAGLQHFGRKFDDFSTEIALLEARLASGTGDPKATKAQAVALRESVETLPAIGDLDTAAIRLEIVIGAADAAIAGASHARTAARAAAIKAKEALCVEAESLAESTQWKATGDRLKAIVEEWRTIRGIDRKTDDALWKRFAKARDTFTRHRGSHFAELDKQRSAAKDAKEALIARAEALSDATDWGETASAYRALMEEWKAAGRAPRDVEDALWTRFRAAQEKFFSRRNKTFSDRDAEFEANAAVKEKLLAEARQDRSGVGAGRREGQDALDPRALGGRRKGPTRADPRTRLPAEGRRGQAQVRRGPALAAHRPGDLGAGGAVPHPGRHLPCAGRQGQSRGR